MEMKQKPRTLSMLEAIQRQSHRLSSAAISASPYAFSPCKCIELP